MNGMLTILSVIINLVLFYSVFEIHFASLKLNERVDCNVSLNASSKRVVLFLADGLSAQLLYNVTAQMNSSYVRNVMENEGSWGISEAGLPTLSSSAVFSYSGGMDFDTTVMWNYLGYANENIDMIFHHANEVFYTGDPNSVGLFSNETTFKWYKWTWNDTLEDKAGLNYAIFDNFSFEKVNDIFLNSSLNETLHKDNVIFFVYITGSDYCGHNTLPFSVDCVNLVKNLDYNVRKAVKAFDKYYGDNKTSFVLTADHGMSESGTHGGGEDILRNTPFVAWGSGIKRGGGSKRKHVLQNIWKTQNLPFVQIKQKDIAPLFSALLGNPSPYHSVGFLPTEILDIDPDTIINSLSCNEKHTFSVVQQLDRIKNNESIPKELMLKLDSAVKSKNVSKTIALSKELHRIYLSQIEKYRTYFKVPLLILISTIYIGWGLYLFEAMNESSIISSMFIYFLCLFLFSVCIVMIIITIVFSWPKCIIVFSVFASLVWFLAIKNCNLKISRENALWSILTSVFVVMVIIGINVGAGRQCMVIIMALIYYFINQSSSKTKILFGWIVSSFILSFVFLDSEIINELPDKHLIKIGALFWIFFAIFNLYYRRGSFPENAFCFALLFIIVVTVSNVIEIHEIQKEKKDKQNHIKLSWFIISITPFLSFMTSTGISHLIQICLSMAPGFILLSVRHEAAGLASFCSNILLWFYMEIQKPKSNRDDYLQGFMLLMYTYVGFFSIGNNDSNSSFNIYWTDCLTNSFHQLTSTLLIIYKTLIPFVILCSVFCSLKKEHKFLEWYLFLNNIVSFYFLLCTKGSGHRTSAITYSITHHTVSNIFPIIVLILMQIIELMQRINVVIVYQLTIAYYRQIEKTITSKFSQNKDI